MIGAFCRAHRLRALVGCLLSIVLTASLLAVSRDVAQAILPIRCAPVPSISAAASNVTYALGGNGTLWDWGDNFAGELGNGTNGNDRLSPINLSGFGELVTISAGATHVLALKSDGTVWSWGYNWQGQLGTGNTINRNTPTKVSGLTDVVTIAAGGAHSFVIKKDGTVWAWGRNDGGELGDGTFTTRLVPTQIPALTGFKAIAPGGVHTLALDGSGRVWSFGNNNNGQLGRGTLYANYPTPGLISSLSGITAISASDVWHSMALRGSDGTVWSWGYGPQGQLGNGAYSDSITPVQASGLSGAVAISAGGYFSLAQKSNGTLWAWGQNSYGELGNTSAGTYRATPIQVMNISGLAAINAGGNHSIALTPGGNTWTWGGNWDGGIGDGTTNHRTTPYQTSVAQTLPGTPTELKAVAGERLAYATWKAPTSAVTQYIVTPYINGAAQPQQATDSHEAAFAVNNLTEGVTYSFTVAAQNCLGEGSATSQSNRVVPTGVQLNDEGFKVEETRLNDRMTLHINTFNGNIKIHERDLRIKGTGLDLAMDRFYNNRASGASVFGNKWTATVGNDVKLIFLANGSLFFNGPGGFQVGFAKNDNGTYESPSGIDATMVKNPDNSYTLTWKGSGEVWQFNPSGATTSRTDRNGNAITFAYGGPAGLMSAITDTQARTTNLAYNAQNRVSSVTDSSGRIHGYQYDASSNLTSYTDPAGGVTGFTYDAGGNLTQVTTPGGRQVSFTYDASKRVISVRRKYDACCWATVLSFTYLGTKTEVTDANLRKTTYGYDPVGRTTSIKDALGNSTSLNYTSNSNVARYQAGGGSAYSFGYSSANSLTSLSGDTGAHYTLGYTDSSHPDLPTTSTDPQGNTTTLAYDAAGNIRTATNQLPYQNQVAITYNSNGTPATSQNANGSLTSYGYDSSGNLTSVAPPAPLGGVTITYDSLSRISTVIDGKSQTTSYQYDSLDRITTTTYSDGTKVIRGYDLDGNLTSMTDTTGTTTMTYDKLGRMTERRTPDNRKASYTYDLADNLLSVTDSGPDSALVVEYLYNPVNLPTQVTSRVVLPAGLPIALGTMDLSYDANYNRTSLRYPNNVTLSSTYDTSNRLTGISAVAQNWLTLFSIGYSYTNPATNQDTALRYSSSGSDHRAGDPSYVTYSTSDSYGYDQLNRLTSAHQERRYSNQSTNENTVNEGDYDYYYDGMSNRGWLTHTRSPSDPSDPNSSETIDRYYEYNEANQLIWTDTYDQYQWDAVSYEYDANGNLTHAVPVGSSTVEGTADAAAAAEAYAYNAADQTVAIARPQAQASFVYRGTGQSERIAALTQGGDPAATFSYTALGLSSQTDEKSTSYFIRDPRGGLLAWRTPASTFFYLLDGIGSVTGLTDPWGQLTARYHYDPFGQTTEVWTPLGNVTNDPLAPVIGEAAGPGSILAAKANPYRFASAYLDPTGLYRMGERYYDPALGRFTQQDPIVSLIDPMQWNRYVYVGDNPVNYIDPTGLGSCASAFSSGTEAFAGGATVIEAYAGGFAAGGILGFFIAVGLGVTGGWLVGIVLVAALGGGSLAAVATGKVICSGGAPTAP